MYVCMYVCMYIDVAVALPPMTKTKKKQKQKRIVKKRVKKENKIYMYSMFTLLFMSCRVIYMVIIKRDILERWGRPCQVQPLSSQLNSPGLRV